MTPILINHSMSAPAPPSTAIGVEVGLMAGGEGHVYLREGWSPLGAADTWTTGPRAVVEFPACGRPSDHSLRIHVAGIFSPVYAAHQRLTLWVNDQVIGSLICRDAGLHEFFVPGTLLEDRTSTTVVLHMPDARRPIDYVDGERDIRFLALRVVKIELLPLMNVPRSSTPAHGDGAAQALIEDLTEQREALMSMESFGVNCEFGFAQRAVGAEPMGLFRWTHAPLEKLIGALDSRLAGLEMRDALAIQVNDAGEFLIQDTVYGFRHHSFVFQSEGGTLDKVRRNEYLRIGLLTKTLLDTLREGRKLIVYHDAGVSSLPQIQRLVQVLQGYGDNTLLWMVTAPQKFLVGHAQQIAPGLIQGYVGGFQSLESAIKPQSPHQPSWISAACDAHRLWCALKAASGERIF